MSLLLSALARNRTGLVLLAGQVALTLAIVANALAIGGRELDLMRRPSGLDEANLISVRCRAPGDALYPQDFARADLDALRALPGVAQATRINVLPLADRGWRTAVDRQPLAGGAAARTHAALYFADEHGPTALGVRLVEGRSFRADEVKDVGPGFSYNPAVALISRALAEALFAPGSAVGRRVYTLHTDSIEIVGVVERLQSAWPGWPLHEHSLLMPGRMHSADALYLIRVADGQAGRVRERVEPRLNALQPPRIVDTARPYAQIRATAYRGARALSLMLGALILALLFVTALGIVGTASAWVESRLQQIGTRRALGAQRADILRHFQLENLLITSTGIVAGSLLAYVLNTQLALHYDVARLAAWQLGSSALVLWALGQLAVLGPALRAAAVPPAVATRYL